MKKNKIENYKNKKSKIEVIEVVSNANMVSDYLCYCDPGGNPCDNDCHTDSCDSGNDDDD
jgi:hypothetical protein